MVKAKKHLGQHFLKDHTIAEQIAQSIQNAPAINNILEIGPGTGMLTQKLFKSYPSSIIKAVELDNESISYLNTHYPKLEVVKGDFLKLHLTEYFTDQFVVIGNFPYNISTQIVFKILADRAFIPAMAGMFQKEVAERICMHPNNKQYGILSVLTQAYYDVEYLFSVSEEVFDPPPKVQSGVMRMIRKSNTDHYPHSTFFNLVKKAFNQRRKMLRSTLKGDFPSEFLSKEIFSLRPENLSYKEFLYLAEEKIKHHAPT